MPSISTFVGLVVASLVAFSPLTAASPSPTSLNAFNPRSDARETQFSALVPRSPEHPENNMTNAQRMRRGLGPKRPKRLHNASKRHMHMPRPSATPSSPDSTPTGLPLSLGSLAGSPQCVPYKGIVSATYIDSTGASVAGFLSRIANAFGEYAFTQSQADAISVSFCVLDSSPFNLVSDNGIETYPNIGPVLGFASNSANLQPGSPNYAYLSGVSPTEPYAHPGSTDNAFTAATNVAQPGQTAVWYLDPTSNMLSLGWINDDGSVVFGTIVYVPSAGAFALTGDMDAFSQIVQNDKATFTFIPA